MASRIDASAVSGEEAYASLLEICTQLIISEGTEDPPIKHALNVLHGLLHCDHLAGDATVLSVRAVRILLDKFLPFFDGKSRVKLVDCVRAALRRMQSVVAANGSAENSLSFVHTKLWELQEELLQCMAAAATQSDDAVCSALPSMDAQLGFCEYVMDVSPDMCLQALRMCCVLLRSGQLRALPLSALPRINGIFQAKLKALESLEVNQDWLRLLRHVIEGLVTVQAYAHQRAPVAELQQPKKKSKKDRKRERSAADTDGAAGMNGAVAASKDTASYPTVTQVQTLLRLCQKVCATPRLDRVFRSTVFSCVSAVLARAASLKQVPALTCAEAVSDLAKELSRDVRMTLTITNPFLSRETMAASGGGMAGAADATGAAPTGSPAGSPTTRMSLPEEDMDEDEEQGEDLLPNREGVRWRTPDPEWPLLILIALLLSADAVPLGEYLWWWVGDDEYARRFARDDTVALTQSFFAGKNDVALKRRGSRVQLSTMRESQWPFAVDTRVLFQPVPCAYDASACTMPSLHASPRRVQELAVALRQCDMNGLLEHLSAASHDDGMIAGYGRTVLLQVLLLAGPDASDATRAVLRELFSEASSAQMVEQVTTALLRQDRGWATTLLEAGVTDTIRRRSTSVTPERSPVLQMLRREAASLPSTPPLQPRGFEAPLCGPAQLTRFLQKGSREEVKELLASLTRGASPWNSTACVQAVVDMAASLTATDGSSSAGDSSTSPLSAATWATQLQHTLVGVVQQQLQELTIEYHSTRSLKETVEAAELVEVRLCETGLSTHFCCPNQHPLHHLHSRNWTCDRCHATGQETAWSCRVCDFDMCPDCARSSCNRLEGAVTATAQDVLETWRANAPAVAVSAEGGGSPIKRAHAVLFTEDGGLVPATRPLACLHQQTLHVADMHTTCACGRVCPGPYTATTTAATDGADADAADVLLALVSVFGATCGQDVGVQRSVLRAYESVAALVFLGGARAVPSMLRRLSVGLAPHLPLAVKHLVTRFLAVECRRFAFQVLHDQTAFVMSATSGVTASTKNHKIRLPREDKAEMLRVLYDTFHSLLSPVVRVDFTFEGEEGFGTGPSQELYTELSTYFRGEQKFWFVTEDDGGSDSVTLAFPSAKALFLTEFYVLGAACARAFVDDFRMNMDLLPQAWNLLTQPSLGFPVDGSLSTRTEKALEELLDALDPSLCRTFEQLRVTPEAELAAMELEMADGAIIASHVALERHIRHTILTRFEIAFENLRQFQWGLLSVVELEAFDCLNSEEHSAMLCGADITGGDGPLFTEDELRMQTTIGNGYSSDSPHVEMLLSIVGGELTRAQQHDFLEFLTGSPRLPFNGLAGLGRLITVAMKDMEGPNEQTLPSCNTCFLYLKLPPYSTHEIMKARLLLAITEGRRNYSLS